MSDNPLLDRGGIERPFSRQAADFRLRSGGGTIVVCRIVLTFLMGLQGNTMRYMPLILLGVFGLELGTADGVHAGNWLRRLCANRMRTTCCRPCPRAPVVCDSRPVVPSTVKVEPEQPDRDAVDFAEIAAVITGSENVTFAMTSYINVTSKDDQQNWLVVRGRSELSYRRPHSFRDTRYDEQGNLWMVQIVDASTNQTLTLDMKEKKAMPKDIAFNVYEGGGGPLDWLAARLEKELPEFVEQREINDMLVDVYRFAPSQPGKKSFDLWIDAATKRLVGMSDPGGDLLDVTQSVDMADAPNRRRWQKGSGRMAGRTRSEIVFDAPLDPDQFSVEPPDGFEVAPAPKRPNP